MHLNPTTKNHAGSATNRTSIPAPGTSQPLYHSYRIQSGGSLTSTANTNLLRARTALSIPTSSHNMNHKLKPGINHLDSDNRPLLYPKMIPRNIPNKPQSKHSNWTQNSLKWLYVRTPLRPLKALPRGAKASPAGRMNPIFPVQT